jgi:rhodanese-related sulfurtransferase
MEKLLPPDLDERLDDPDTFVLDIRPRADFQRERVDGSRNVPVYDALKAGDEDALRDRLGAVPRDEHVVTVCKMGVVATRATRLLEAEGYDASTLAGGIHGWRGYQNDTLLYKLRSLVWRLH